MIFYLRLFLHGHGGLFFNCLVFGDRKPHYKTYSPTNIFSPLFSGLYTNLPSLPLSPQKIILIIEWNPKFIIEWNPKFTYFPNIIMIVSEKLLRICKLNELFIYKSTFLKICRVRLWRDWVGFGVLMSISKNEATSSACKACSKKQWFFQIQNRYLETGSSIDS